MIRIKTSPAEDFRAKHIWRKIINNHTIYTCKHGKIAHYNDDDTIGRSLQLYGEWGEQEIYLISKHVNSNDTVLDIGANVGSHSLAFSSMVGDKGQVIAVDAQHQIFNLLCLNVILNNLNNVLCLNALMCSELSIESIPHNYEIRKTNYGAVSFVNRRTEPSTVSLPILGLTVDSLKLKRCNLIKIDVEAMEYDVLSGAYKTLVELKPYIYFEQTSSKNFEDIFKFLSAIGYTMYWHISNPFNQHNFNKLQVNIFGGACEVNIFCVPDGKKINSEISVNLVEIIEPIYNPPFPADSIDGWTTTENI